MLRLIIILSVLNLFCFQAHAYQKCQRIVENNKNFTSVNFLAFGDTQVGHHLHEELSPRDTTNGFQVRALNKIFDGAVNWPDNMTHGRGKINKIRGVLIAGDITQMAREGEWDTFEKEYFGLCGNQDNIGTLKYPVYEGYGNHDFIVYPSKRENEEPVLKAIGQRNSYRADIVRHTSSERAHYSWKWDNVHFINVNVKPGDYVETIFDKKGKIKRRIDPRGSLDFLKNELERQVEDKETPVVIMTHYPPYSHRMKASGKNEKNMFYRAIKDYNVIAIVAGHTHKSRHVKWRGFDVFESAGPFLHEKNSEYRGQFNLFRITNDTLTVQDIRWRPLKEVNSDGNRKIKLSVNRGWSFSKSIKNPRARN